jgi:hypothetical protein
MYQQIKTKLKSTHDILSQLRFQTEQNDNKLSCVCYHERWSGIYARHPLVTGHQMRVRFPIYCADVT